MLSGFASYKAYHAWEPKGYVSLGVGGNNTTALGFRQWKQLPLS